jgi:LPS export ABC transporter protein LptC
VRTPIVPAVILCAVLAAGCSLDYQAAVIEAEADQSLPDTVAVKMVYRMVKGSHPVVELQADKAETYTKRNQTILEAARFSEFGTDGGIATKGEAESVVYHTDTKNAEISGSVYVYSAAQEGSISTEYVKWEDKTRVLSANPEDLVVVKKDDGSYISGRGFVGDFRAGEVKFNGPVEGAYMYEK